MAPLTVPNRCRNGADMTPTIEDLLRKGETIDDLRRAFMENVAVDPCGCWYWRDSGDTYGNFRGKPAHCVSWELHQGPIPKGLYILHGCDVAGLNERAQRGCVNPAHLRPGTPRENARDTARARKSAPKRGKWRVWETADPNGPRTKALSIRVNEYEAAALSYLRIEYESTAAGILKAAMQEALRLLELYEGWTPPPPPAEEPT